MNRSPVVILSLSLVATLMGVAPSTYSAPIPDIPHPSVVVSTEKNQQPRSPLHESILGSSSGESRQIVVPDIALSSVIEPTEVTAAAPPPPPPPPAPPAQPLPKMTPSEDQNINQKLVDEAKKYLGVPYVYGGSSPQGFDCSGLTQYVYAQLGISIPRTAQLQTDTLERVTDPQPGDIVAWGYHVGIYAGDGMVIHAPVPNDYVKISAIWGDPVYVRPR